MYPPLNIDILYHIINMYTNKKVDKIYPLFKFFKINPFLDI